MLVCRGGAVGLDGSAKAQFDTRDVVRARTDLRHIEKFARVHVTNDEVFISLLCFPPSCSSMILIYTKGIPFVLHYGLT